MTAETKEEKPSIPLRRVVSDTEAVLQESKNLHAKMETLAKQIIETKKEPLKWIGQLYEVLLGEVEALQTVDLFVLKEMVVVVEGLEKTLDESRKHSDRLETLFRLLLDIDIDDRIPLTEVIDRARLTGQILRQARDMVGATPP